MTAADSVPLLERRARIVAAIRSFFNGQGFVEVETAVRIAAPAPEEHIDCPVVPPPSAPGVVGDRATSYLRASPELQMKKLLAAGMERIYQVGPCFREGERGARHNPEFTMLEWYRRGVGYLELRDDLAELLAAVSDAAPGLRRMDSPAEVLAVRDAYRRFAGWDPWSGEWDQDRFDFDMAEKVEPAIKAMGGGVFLTDYPPAAASLALVSGEGEPYAERWEFYWDGIELANCFSELCDAAEQRRRFEHARARRRELGEEDYPLDEEFLCSLPAIGRAAGAALGVDRLVMALVGAADIASVRAQA
ncbi:MAG: EF-P lysine aminoacylase GenX [Kiritimatiellae bacterium]|nr:EF-P lysine aminoacylase GenX [Kiritimatiellia bacterium]